MNEPRSEALFSYGTLQLEAVQFATFGRRLDGSADAMPGFRKAMIEIADPDVRAVSGADHHPVAVRTDDPDDAIEGTVFRITPEELGAADRYEVEAYRRVSVRLRSGIDAWVYILA